MTKKLFPIKAISIGLLACVVVFFVGCNLGKDFTINSSNTQTENLQKLCKVWGYVKYTHPVFLLGQKDWDAELLKLIPEVQAAKNDAQTNEILTNWFNELGPVDYGTNSRVSEWVNATEDQLSVQADLSWTTDTAYLGESLVTGLSQLKEIPAIRNWSKAPMTFAYDEAHRTKITTFPNEKTYENMDYSDVNYRLLGLFRYWNAMEYYFPYLDILDENWHDVLTEFIPKMLEGSDKQSYELTLAAMSTKLHDAHVLFQDKTFLKQEFGQYTAPVVLTKAEGKLLVSKRLDDTCPLLPGDILLELDGEAIDNVISHRKQYHSITTDDKILAVLGNCLLSSHNEMMDITVLRENKELTLKVKGFDDYIPKYKAPESSHKLLDNNIGLINPVMLASGEIFSIMAKFKDTDGLIVDLRQYPSDYIVFSLGVYLVEKPTPFELSTKPSMVVPGTFLKVTPAISGYDERMLDKTIYYYKNKVVVLIDECTWSQPEFTTMSLRNGKNVVVMGENSIGADGDMAWLPLPDGNQVSFSCLGVYTPEGGQTQRIGLSPDIYINRTIEGVKDGRDEFIEQAVQYILDENQTQS